MSDPAHFLPSPDFLRSLLDNATTILGYARGSLVRSADPSIDARTDVDRELKRACEDLITHCCRQGTAPLRSFLDQCTAYLGSSRPAPNPSASAPASQAPTSTATISTTDLANQSFATPQKVKEAHDAFKNGVLKALQTWQERLMLYLQDEETVRVLMPPAQVSHAPRMDTKTGRTGEQSGQGLVVCCGGVLQVPDYLNRVCLRYKKRLEGGGSAQKRGWGLMSPDTASHCPHLIVSQADPQNAIVDQYRQFHDLVRAEYDFSTAASIMTPSAVATLLMSGKAGE